MCVRFRIASERLSSKDNIKKRDKTEYANDTFWFLFFVLDGEGEGQSRAPAMILVKIGTLGLIARRRNVHSTLGV